MRCSCGHARVVVGDIHVPEPVLPPSVAALRPRNLSGIWSRHDSFRCRSTASMYLDANATSLDESLENSSSLPKMWKTNFSIFRSRVRRYDASKYLTRSISIWYIEIPNASMSSGCSFASSTCACCWITNNTVNAHRCTAGCRGTSVKQQQIYVEGRCSEWTLRQPVHAVKGRG